MRPLAPPPYEARYPRTPPQVCNSLVLLATLSLSTTTSVKHLQQLYSNKGTLAELARCYFTCQ